MDENEIKSFSFQATLSEYEKKVDLECVDCEEKFEMQNQKAIALVGDRFYKGVFLAGTELEKAYEGWNNTLHDIGHRGTGVPQVNGGLPDITKFIGYNDNVQFNQETKTVSMDIHINDKTKYAEAWRGYVDLCKQAGQTPNVSVSFNAKTKYVRAADLPENVNYSAYGYSRGDMVLYIYNIQPKALSTVFHGVCDDRTGCGIGINQESEPKETGVNEAEQQAKKDEIIKWLKNKKEENL